MNFNPKITNVLWFLISFIISFLYSIDSNWNIEVNKKMFLSIQLIFSLERIKRLKLDLLFPISNLTFFINSINFLKLSISSDSNFKFKSIFKSLL